LENTSQNLNALILCASGVGTSQLLSSKLENYYPEINIIESSAIYEIEESYFNKNNINLVISTIPTPKFPVPVINVSPFLTKEDRSEEHTSELQSRFDLVCRLLLETKKTTI